MNLETNQSEVIRQYLLGLAPEEELTAVDERLVTDPEFYDELLIVESELIDQYLSNELSAAERASFESHFLISRERQQQLSFARSFHNYILENAPELDSEPSVAEVPERSPDVPKPPPKPAPQPWYHFFLPVRNPTVAYALMLGVLLVVAGITWWRLKDRSPEGPGVTYAVSLVPGTTRGVEDGSKKISIPPGTGTVELKAQLLRENYDSYRAICLDENGAEVMRSDNLQPKTESGIRYVSVGIRAGLLPPGNYSLRISGRESDGRFEDLPVYRFQIQR